MTAERVILLDGSKAALDFSLTPFYRVLYVHKYTSPPYIPNPTKGEQ